MSNNEQLFRVVASIFKVDLSSINELSSPDTLEAWDSLGMVQLVVELEQVFNVKFNILEIADFYSVGIIKTVLAEKGVNFDKVL